MKFKDRFSSLFGNMNFKDYYKEYSSMIKNEKEKSPQERKNDIIALVLTIIIIAILIFIFWKVPVLHNFLFF